MKTSELTGAALNNAVMSCEGLSKRLFGDINYSGDWYHGGPIIERERIGVWHYQQKDWMASWWKDGRQAFGPAPLIAAMRCYVASKLGDDVEIPQGMGM